MKLMKACFGFMVLLLIAVAFAGCSGTSPQQPPPPSGGQATQAAGGVQQTPAGGSPSGSTAAQVLGAVNYNWVEYKMTSGAGGQQIAMYMKIDKQKGTCSMRVEGQNIPGMTGKEMPCGQSTGGQTSGGQAGSDPNQVSPGVSWTFVGTESVTVPAGTFTASKYNVATSQGVTMIYWVVPGKPLVKMVTNAGQGSSTMELNGWG